MPKHFIATSAALAFALCSFSAHAIPPGHLPPTPHQGVDSSGLMGQSVVEGQVQRMLINPYGEGRPAPERRDPVRFAPHNADALTAMVKPGDRVRIIGRAQRGARSRPTPLSTSTAAAPSTINRRRQVKAWPCRLTCVPSVCSPSRWKVARRACSPGRGVRSTA